ncbi:hypothetical protein glysoja_033184 [Glycine soja]|uniref:Uncharacterized protein n=1 Tax=Glycine soja TaxID=3848 RepID=A0A0B2R7K6_GLYSO|nr:hypothetical protein glysoja_033184 [Glycine soja]
MDPCPFVRILVGNLAVKSPASSKPSSFSGKVHPSSSPFFCKILLQGLDSNSTSPRVSSVPLISDSDPHPHSFAASFDFSKAQILKASKKPLMKISVYKGPTTPSCVFTSAKLLGKVSIPLDLTLAESRPCTFHNGWLSLSKNTNPSQLLHLTGKFAIDATSGVTPVNTPRGSWDLGSGSGSGSNSDFGLEPNFFYNKGFVMSAMVSGEGKCSKPEVEVGVQHVTCTEDAAAFVALAAALDLSIDACKLFSQKLRKELRQ